MVGRFRPHVARLGVLKTHAAVLALGLLVAIALMASPASAQGFGWLGKLFGGRQPAAPQAVAPSLDRPDKGLRARPRHVAEPPHGLREKDRPPAKNATVFVYVLGDALGQNLASGLDDALADRQDVAIIHKARGATGLAAMDVFDWPKAVDAMLAGEAKGDAAKPGPGKSGAEASRMNKAEANVDPAKAKTKINPVQTSSIDVAVMMIGSNDRQAIRLAGEILKPGTADWSAEYKRRVMAIDDAFRRNGIPLIWVGVPIVRDDGSADDMAALNELYRAAAEKTATVYVDTWEAFSDDNGDFRAVGPDINGQLTRLRTADGIYFTKAGSRKLAHFVEVHVRRALDGKMTRPPPEAPATGLAFAQKPDVGPISTLTEPPLSRGGELAAAYRADEQVQASNGRFDQTIPAGRADDLKWPASGMPKP